MQSNSNPESRLADREMAVSYIRENFDQSDRLAVVLLNKRTHDVIQRIAAVDKIAAADFQAWLRFQNKKMATKSISP